MYTTADYHLAPDYNFLSALGYRVLIKQVNESGDSKYRWYLGRIEDNGVHALSKGLVDTGSAGSVNDCFNACLDAINFDS